MPCQHSRLGAVPAQATVLSGPRLLKALEKSSLNRRAELGLWLWLSAMAERHSSWDVLFSYRACGSLSEIIGLQGKWASAGAAAHSKPRSSARRSDAMQQRAGGRARSHAQLRTPRQSLLARTLNQHEKLRMTHSDGTCACCYVGCGSLSNSLNFR